MSEVKMKGLVFRRAMWAGGAGIFGALAGPHMDVPWLIGIWVSLLVQLAEMADLQLTKDDATKVATTALGGIATFITGLKLAGTYFAWTGIGLIPVVIINVGTNGVLTYLFGMAATRAFLSKRATITPENLAITIIGIVAAMLGIPYDGDSTIA